MDEKVINGEFLLSIGHSPHEGHDDCLHKCMVNVGGTTLGTECKKATLPELGVGIESQVFLFDKSALRMTLRQEGKQFSQRRCCALLTSSRSPMSSWCTSFGMGTRSPFSATRLQKGCADVSVHLFV